MTLWSPKQKLHKSTSRLVRFKPSYFGGCGAMLILVQNEDALKDGQRMTEVLQLKDELSIERFELTI